MRILKSVLLGVAILLCVPAAASLMSALTVDPVVTAAPEPPQTPAQGQAVPPRIEKDLLGEKSIPGDAYYGVQTLRGMENFQLSGIAINHYPGFIEAWAVV